MPNTYPGSDFGGSGSDNTDFFGLTPKQDFQVGAGLGAAGDLLSGIGGFLGGEASASEYKREQQNVNEFTALQEYAAKRQAYQVQSRAQAEIGAAGLAGGGSAEEILRSNAQNLALDQGLINFQGGLKAGQLGMEARAASTSAVGDLIGGVFKAGGAAITAGLI